MKDERPTHPGGWFIVHPSSFLFHRSFPHKIRAAMKATVTVELKPSVLDPQGKAIEHSLSSLGFSGVEDVRVGKLFRITLADSGQTRENVETQLRQMCERLLANTVIEKFSYTLEE